MTSRRLPRWIGPDGESPDATTTGLPGARRSEFLDDLIRETGAPVGGLGALSHDRQSFFFIHQSLVTTILLQVSTGRKRLSPHGILAFLYSETPEPEQNGSHSMASVTSLTASVHQRLADALLGSPPEAGSPEARCCDEATGPTSRPTGSGPREEGEGEPARELATQVVARVESGEVIKDIEVSGPGFLNITITDKAITENLAARYEDGERLGVPLAENPGTTVIDYAQPNVAKEIHVGHLRSAVIGDAVVQILEFTGERGVRRHHRRLGHPVRHAHPVPNEHPHELDQQGRGGVRRGGHVEPEPALQSGADALRLRQEVKTRARRRVVDLQAGEPETLAMWQKFVDESKIYFYSVFDKLDMEIQDPDVVGESGYNDMLDETCRLLEESGVAVRSDGALCVFFDDVKGPDGNPVPLIVKKSDGGYGYAATDLSAIRDRVLTCKANTLVYVVDARQSLHFKMVFETARRAGWLGDDVQAQQLAFGTVLGKDGKPFKTREGETVRLVGGSPGRGDRPCHRRRGRRPRRWA